MITIFTQHQSTSLTGDNLIQLNEHGKFKNDLKNRQRLTTGGDRRTKEL